MPDNLGRTLRAQYLPLPDRQNRIRSARVGIKHVLAMEGLIDIHRKELLSVLIWKLTEADGKFACRYRSAGVLSETVSKIQHEHVVPRKVLIEQLLEKPEKSDEILDQAEACLVTIEEHSRLGAVDASIKGWDRYKAAEVIVYDMKTMKPRP